MTSLRFLLAEAKDIATIEVLWREAAAWLASRGIDQWQYPVKLDVVRRSVAAGECWLVFDGEDLAGTLTLDEESDPDFWAPSDHPQEALYLHKMIVRRSSAGKDLGRDILDWATGEAKKKGKRWLRLDAWRDNPGLQRYYEARGFEHVRTVIVPNRRSGVLFQRVAT